MVLVADLGTHCAHTYPINHLAGVTVVPTKNKNQAMRPQVPKINSLESPT